MSLGEPQGKCKEFRWLLYYLLPVNDTIMHSTNHRLGAEGSYLTLFGVADRIL